PVNTKGILSSRFQPAGLVQNLIPIAFELLSIMASTAIVLLATFAFLNAFSAPLDSPGNTTSVEIIWVTDVMTSSFDVLETATTVVTVAPSSSAVPLLVVPDDSSTPFLSSTASSSAPITTAVAFTTVVVTTVMAPPTTVTVSAPPTTVTDFITITPPPTPTIMQTAWAAPAQMTDLSAFKVANFAYGKQNMRIVNAVLPTTSTPDAVVAAADIPDSMPNSTLPNDNSTALLQLFYPANSINPSSEPQGGADFYATPLDLKHAQNVTLEYSVFFPSDFDWVLAGKMPGMYGGHDGCSGGDDALECFSTRLMWRPGGAGELYLYAPKNKQTDALCSTPPQSVCDADYGLSVGRGSFKFAAGAWTHVRQTVSLNTPGEQDGAFILEVNGQEVINRSDVFYRDHPAPPDPEADGPEGDETYDGEPFEFPLGNVLASIDGRVSHTSNPNSDVGADADPVFFAPPTFIDQQPSAGTAATDTTTLPECMLTATSTVTASPTIETVTLQSTSTATAYVMASPSDAAAWAEQDQPSQPVGFTGLFFSTFFGGHEPKYASPKDQYTWFKDFAMTINDNSTSNLMSSRKLRVAFIHPDLGIGGAERLIVDAALGLQRLGHFVEIYTSHHDPKHCFDETRDGTLRIRHIKPPFPRTLKGKFHILFSHARQLHLTSYLLSSSAPKYDVYFVDQLSTCIPLLRTFARTRVVFYCHFPDKLLAHGQYIEGSTRTEGCLLKRLYRLPMDFLEEMTTKQADVILANSKFTAGVFKRHFSSIHSTPKVVYPGINLLAYEPTSVDNADPDIIQVSSSRPTLLSLNRFERKKNAALAIDSFALLRHELSPNCDLRLVIAGGYDPRLEDNMMTLVSLIDRAKASRLTYDIVKPSTSSVTIPPFNCTKSRPDVLFLLNFTTAQRSALLSARNTQSVVDEPPDLRTGWLRAPDAHMWANALLEIINMPEDERKDLAERARRRAREHFGMEAMAKGLESALEEAVAMGRYALPFNCNLSARAVASILHLCPAPWYGLIIMIRNGRHLKLGLQPAAPTPSVSNTEDHEAHGVEMIHTLWRTARRAYIFTDPHCVVVPPKSLDIMPNISIDIDASHAAELVGFWSQKYKEAKEELERYKVKVLPSTISSALTALQQAERNRNTPSAPVWSPVGTVHVVNVANRGQYLIPTHFATWVQQQMVQNRTELEDLRCHLQTFHAQAAMLAQETAQWRANQITQLFRTPAFVDSRFQSVPLSFTMQDRSVLVSRVRNSYPNDQRRLFYFLPHHLYNITHGLPQVGQSGYWFRSLYRRDNPLDDRCEMELLVEKNRNQWTYLGSYVNEPLGEFEMKLTEWVTLDAEAKAWYCHQAAMRMQSRMPTQAEIANIMRLHETGQRHVPCYGLRCTGFNMPLYHALHAATKILSHLKMNPAPPVASFSIDLTSAEGEASEDEGDVEDENAMMSSPSIPLASLLKGRQQIEEVE
ncbi:Alpha-1,3/1,6-mannosyltransferase ALG2, partial [Grifola frondosa]